MLRRTEGNEDGKKFSRSKYELPWRLRNESLAQDPMKVAAHIAPNAINAAGERPLKPNWHSMANGDGMSRWHLTSRCTSEQTDDTARRTSRRGAATFKRADPGIAEQVRPEGILANGMRRHRRAERMRGLAKSRDRVPVWG
jgi:hypothetical protein